MNFRIHAVSIFLFISASAFASTADKSSSTESQSIPPEIKALIREVQGDYMNCMVSKLPEFDDSVSDVAEVASALQVACESEAAAGADKLRSVDASLEYRNMLADEFLKSLEGHSIRLVNRWRKHPYREPPYYNEPFHSTTRG